MAEQWVSKMESMTGGRCLYMEHWVSQMVEQWVSKMGRTMTGAKLLNVQLTLVLLA